MNRRHFMTTTGMAALAAGIAQTARAAGDRPNILWLISEDTCPDLHCYGEPLVATPHLDRLAAEGTRFTRAYATAPVCSAVRSGMITGMYQTSIGAHNHRSHRDDGYRPPAPVRTLPEYFREAGYYTCNTAGLEHDKPGKMDWNFTVDAPAFDGTDWSGRAPGQPFYAQINFHYTHRPFERDRERPINPDAVTLPPYYPDHPVARRDWADYLESAQLLDKQIGEVLARLDAEGLAENTLVLYFGDHGHPHVRGKSWLYEGGIHVPLLARWPERLAAGAVREDLVSSVDFAPATLAAAGIAIPECMRGRDFLARDAATRTEIFAARDRCDETVDRIRCVRTNRHKLIRNYYPERPYTQFNAYRASEYPVLTLMHVLHNQGKLTPDQEKFMAAARPAEELYDLESDPFELTNLAESPEHAALRDELRARLDAWSAETGDKGAQPEAPEVLAKWQKEAKKRFEKTMQARGLAPDCSPEVYLAWWERKLLG